MIRFRALGALDLRDSAGGECRALLAQPKRVALLAYLALATPRGPHRRDTLLALLWPELDTEHARNALSQAVHFLRRALGPDTLVSQNGDELELVSAEVWSDVLAFEHALGAATPAEAVDLYRGDLLEGFHVGHAPEFERWLGGERSRLASCYQRAVEAVAAEREAAGDAAGAVALWRRLAGRDPLNGHVTLRYMRALAASGDRSAALQHARVYDTLLREELSASPDAEFAALVRELQSSTTGASRSARGDDVTAADACGTPADTREITTTSGTQPDSRFAERRVAAGRRWPGHQAVLAAGSLLLVIIAGGAVALRNSVHTGVVAPIRSLAVLPLDDLSGDAAQRSFADGMHDALITELARYPELSVISRTSMIQYRNTTKSLPEIARELKVDGVVEGALLRDGNRVRMSAQLVHGPSDRHLWADHYERDLRDILTLQGELAAAIARQVRVATRPVTRPPRDMAGPAGSPPRELYLRELYLRGRHAEISRSPIGVATAREAYRRAVALDSTFALGWAGLAAVHGFMADYAYAPVQPALDTARMMARRAVALDSTLPEARVALGVTLGDAHDFTGAEREFRRAIELGPSNARAHYWYSILLVALGRGPEALREAERALALDPFAPRGGLAMKRYATYLLTGEYPHLRLPITERRPILKLEPGEPWARATEAVEFAEVGKCKEARIELARALSLVPRDNFRMLPNVGLVDWSCGERRRARALLARMKTRPDARDHGFRIALLHVGLGETDSAFVWLDRQRWTMAELSALSAGWPLAPIRSDPRYPALLQRLGLRRRP